MTSGNPLRWPEGWQDAAALDLLHGTAIDSLVIPDRPEFSAVRVRARELGIAVVDAGKAPERIRIVPGVWPGVQWPSNGAGAGPTGIPWVDSNGWLIRLHRAWHPDAAIWVDALPPASSFVTADGYLIAIADSAAHGGRWIIALDTPLANGLAAGNGNALALWKSVAAAADFFAAHKDWADYPPVGTIGVLSDFTGDNEFFSRELLNLMGRAGLHYHILLKDRIAPTTFDSLRAVSYTDTTPPTPDLRRRVLRFVEAGGLVIAAPVFGDAGGTPVDVALPAGYQVRTLGKGRIARASETPSDPYTWAADAAVLVSHRYDLVRFWNSGAARSYFTLAPGRKQAVVHLLFFAGRGPDSATVRVSGRYRAARAFTVDAPALANLAMQPQGDGVEVRLPQVSQYVALELDI